MEDREVLRPNLELLPHNPHRKAGNDEEAEQCIALIFTSSVSSDQPNTFSFSLLKLSPIQEDCPTSRLARTANNNKAPIIQNFKVKQVLYITDNLVIVYS